MVFYNIPARTFSERWTFHFRQRGVFYLSAANHARTLWGCKYNPVTELIEQLYITDSDDRKIMLWDPVDISISKTGQIRFGAVPISTVYVFYAYSG